MKRLSEAAKIRAQRLRTYAYHDRKTQDISFEQGVASLMGGLLRTAATPLNRSDSSIAMYEDRFDKDWLTKTEQLKGTSEEILSRYMPLGWRGRFRNSLKLENLAQVIWSKGDGQG